MKGHAFVDESKERGYYLAAAVLRPGDLIDARKAMKALILPRQPRVHFVKEGTARRRQILDIIAALCAEIVLYDASGHADEKKARTACLVQLVDDLATRQTQLLVLELDDSVVEYDQRLLYRQVRLAGCANTLNYRTNEPGRTLCWRSPTRSCGAGAVEGSGAPARKNHQ